MPDRDAVRAAVWERLRPIAVPDSRFHLDFSMFIPDYPGSERIPQALTGLPGYDRAGVVFVTPDNNLEGLRAELLRAGRSLLMTTYGIRRGFVTFPPGSVPAGSIDHAASLDGAERFGTRCDLTALRALGRLDLLVTGACVVSRDGIRFGKGHGYFDVEWALLREIGSVDAGTPVVACVHDVQYVDLVLDAGATDTVVDWVVTPTRVVQLPQVHPKPSGVHWKLLDPELLENVPPLRELAGAMAGPTRSARARPAPRTAGAHRAGAGG